MFDSTTLRKDSRAKTQKVINRRFSPIIADKDSDISPQRRRVRRERMAFCLSGDDDKQKHFSIADNNRTKILKRYLTPYLRRLSQRTPSKKCKAHGAKPDQY